MGAYGLFGKGFTGTFVFTVGRRGRASRRVRLTAVILGEFPSAIKQPGPNGHRRGLAPKR